MDLHPDGLPPPQQQLCCTVTLEADVKLVTKK
jgi:hypothetical protein